MNNTLNPNRNKNDKIENSIKPLLSIFPMILGKYNENQLKKKRALLSVNLFQNAFKKRYNT